MSITPDEMTTLAKDLSRKTKFSTTEIAGKIANMVTDNLTIEEIRIRLLDELLDESAKRG